MAKSIIKFVCNVCEWKGINSELLVGKSPFADENIYGCPDCKEINDFFCACEETDCWEKITCGTPTPSGYKSTCGNHIPKDNLNNG